MKLFEAREDIKTGTREYCIRIPFDLDVKLMPTKFQLEAERIARKTDKTSDILMALSEWFVTYEEKQEGK